MPLFRTERDARVLLDLLDHATHQLGGWTVYAYCLMPNHVHYVVRSDVGSLSRVMQHVNGLYAQRFNREHGYRGHLFQGRFHAKPITDEPHLPGAIRYVLLNPVRAGLCERPEQWRWSSCRASLGLAPVPRFLALEETLGLFGTAPASARARLADFLAAALPAAPGRGQTPGLSPAVSGQQLAAA